MSESDNLAKLFEVLPPRVSRITTDVPFSMPIRQTVQNICNAAIDTRSAQGGQRMVPVLTPLSHAMDELTLLIFQPA